MKNFELYLFAASIILSFLTYVTQNLIGVGEIIAEGVPLALGIMAFAIKIYKAKIERKVENIKYYYIMYIILIVYLIINTSIKIITDNLSLYSYIFIYQYIPLLMILNTNIGIDDKTSHSENYNILISIIVIMAVLSSFVGIGQVLGLDLIVPIDINRARGLSRSTLNYGALMVLGYVAGFYLRNNYAKIICCTIVFFGIISSQSRGALLSAIVFTIVINCRNIYKHKYFLIGIVTSLCILIGSINTNNAKIESVKELKWRIENTFNLKAGDNLLRLQRYKNVEDNITIFGNGLGSTGPAAGRFNPDSANHESYFLALLVQLGIVGIIFFIFIFIAYLMSNSNGYSNKSLFALAIALSVSFSLQQTMETPVVNITTWILIYLLIEKRRE